MKRIAIIGGGISGLTAAYRLRARGFLVTLFEAEDKPGGKARGERRNGYLLEHGPNGWLADRTEVTDLAKEVGLESRIIRPTDAYQSRFIVLDDRGLLPVPTSPPAMIKTKLLTFTGKMGLFSEPFAKKPPPDEEETIAAFGRRRVLDTLQTGIYAGDMERLSMASCFPAVLEMEQQHGSLFNAVRALSKGPKRDRALLTFPEGVAELTTTLAQKLGGMVKLGARVLSWRREGSQIRLMVEQRGNREEHETDALVFTSPGRSQSDLLASHHTALSEKIRSIVYAPVSVVTLGYRRADVAHPLNGFGFLCPNISKKRLLGVLFSSSVFPGRSPEGKVVLRCLIGGARDTMHTTRPNDELQVEARTEVESLLNITAAPEFSEVLRHDEAIPQYHIGHGQKIKEIFETVKGMEGVFLGGSAYHGVALYDCVKDAERLTREVSEWAA
jgi:protoporphyrinogen/coproporphyrinogen III oxidase